MAKSYLKSIHTCPSDGSCYRPWFLLPRAGDAMAVPWTSGTSSSCRAAALNKHKMMACPLAATRATPDLHRTSASNSIIRRLTGKTRESAQSNNSRQTRTYYIKITKPPWRNAQPRNICTFLRNSSRLNADNHALNIEKSNNRKTHLLKEHLRAHTDTNKKVDIKVTDVA